MTAMPDPSDLPASAPDIPAEPASLPDRSVGLDLTGVHPHALDPHQRVAVELPCRQCGYNLRTLHAGAHCVECGHPVRQSIAGDYLRFADPAWLDTLARGALFSLITLVASFAYGMVIGGLEEVIPDGLSALILSSHIVFGLALAVMSWLATIWITRPQPDRDDGFDRPDALRRWSRHLLLVAVVTGALGVGIEVADYVAPDLLTLVGMPAPTTTAVNPTTPANPPTAAALFSFEDFTAMDLTWLGLNGVGQLIGLAGLFCLAWYLRRLALRAPARGLAKQTVILFWCWIGLIVVGLLSAVLFVVYLTTAVPTGGFGGFGAIAVMAVLGCGGALVAVGLSIWALVVHILYLTLFKKQVRLAGEIQATLTAPI